MKADKTRHSTESEAENKELLALPKQSNAKNQHLESVIQSLREKVAELEKTQAYFSRPEEHVEHTRQKGHAQQQVLKEQRDELILPILKMLRANGWGARRIRRALNSGYIEGYEGEIPPAPRGGPWSVGTVSSIINRLEL